MAVTAVAIRRLAELILGAAPGRLWSSSEAAYLFSFVELKPVLISLMGHGGFRLLISQALTHAQTEATWLRGVRSKGDGTLEGLDEVLSKTSSGEMVDGAVTFLTHILLLLVRFIGADMTRKVLQQTWPHALETTSNWPGDD